MPEEQKITQQDRLDEVMKLAKDIKKPIPVKRFIRHKVIREEVVYAYISPVPSSVEVSYQTLRDDKYVKVRANRQVNKGSFVVIRQDGSRETYTADEFNKLYELLENCNDCNVTLPAREMIEQKENNKIIFLCSACQKKRVDAEETQPSTRGRR